MSGNKFWHGILDGEGVLILDTLDGYEQCIYCGGHCSTSGRDGGHGGHDAISSLLGDGSESINIFHRGREYVTNGVS